MKYPQLVSTKAVNEISDWLIKRLEDLDIEHPGVYSRLLLSLLHTPLKINAIDLLEDLKQPYRLFNKNNEELKRLAAVESLMEVSAEENKSNIVNLVNELHKKLQKIEKNIEESSMIGRTPNSANTAAAAPSPNSALSLNPKFYNKSLKKIKRHHANENPTKNYYLAFPALNSTKKASALIAQEAGEKQEPACFDEGSKEASKSLNLLSWSNLIAPSSANKRDAQKASSMQNENLSRECAIKTPQNQQRRKQKRYDKRECGNRRSQKAATSTDVQFTAKPCNATFSPKKMQKVKSNANLNVNNNSKAKYQRNLYDSSTKRVVSGNRNTNLSNIAQSAPKWDGGALGPWDMDFKGHWEMDHDLVGEFIQQQQSHGFNKKSFIESKHTAPSDFDDAMFMRCLPTKLIDESLVDESDPMNLKPFKEDHSISSLQSKFDEKVKAIWGGEGGDIDPMKPLTYKQQFAEDDGISLASLASSFASEKNSLSLFNFNEQQQQPRSFIIEVNVPPFYNEMTSSYGGGRAFLTDHTNNKQPVASTMYGGRGAMSKSSSFGASPLKNPGDHYSLKKSDFIKSGTNLQASIWSDENFADSEAERLILKKEVGDRIEYDGSDEVDSTCKKLSSIGTELKQWQSSCVEDEEVSLINHSVQSAFKRFKPQLSSTIIRANYHPLNMSSSERMKRVEEVTLRDSPIDNYFTSEKTHFSPIMRDGDTFTINSNWDDIQYERSESGSLLYKSKPHQVWKSPSYISCGIDLEAMEDEDNREKLSIKFALNENNKASQTDGSAFATFNKNSCVGSRSYLEINEEYCRRKIYDGFFNGVDESVNTNKWRCLNSGNDDSNDYSFFSVNRLKGNNCVAGNNESLQPFPDIQHFSSNNSSSSSISTITSALLDTVAEPFESWRNLIDHDRQHTCMHSLWEQCIICARKIDERKLIEKPLPANRLLKDELQMDGDEIMNVIQNLYITSDYGCDEDDDDKDECDGFDVNHVMNIIAMDDSMDGIEPAIEDESKFYETAIDLNSKCQKSRDVIDGFDEITMAKMEQEMDQEKWTRFLKWVQSTLVQENTTITQDTNNNECLEIQRSTNNRKRRHSTCQNLMEKKRYYSQEEGFSCHLNLASGVTPFMQDFPKDTFDVNKLFFDASKMLKINIEKVFLIADPCLEMEAIKDYQQNNNNYCGANYYRNILQQQHALIKHLDLSRPLTR